MEDWALELDLLATDEETLLEEAALDDILLDEAKLDDSLLEDALLDDTAAGALDATLLELATDDLIDDEEDLIEDDETARLLATDDLELAALLELEELAPVCGALAIRIQFKLKLPLVALTPK